MAGKLLKEKQAEIIRDRSEEALSNLYTASELSNQQSSDK